MGAFHVRTVVWLGVVAAVAGCDVPPAEEADPPWAAPTPSGDPTPQVPDTPGAEVEPAAPRTPRLTRAQYRHTLRDLLGADIVLPTRLEPDSESEGLFAIGATVASVSPRGVEQYADGAHSVAEQVVATPERRRRLSPCQPEGATDEACLERFVRDWGRRLWRRPLTDDEADTLVDLGRQATGVLDDFWAGPRYALAAMLQSPKFLYRLEQGEAMGDGSGDRRYTDFEMASRLAFFLWNAAPDDALLDAAEAGNLTDDAGLTAQVERMLASPKARRGVRNFFTEWLDLHALDELSKDPNIFAHYSPDLGGAARQETLHVVERLVFEEQADYRELFTTRETFVNGRLAAIYGVPASAEEGFGPVELPPGGPRAGLFGHVSFLALHAHPVSSSATLRGLFIREQILCQDVPSPPAELNTSIPEPDPSAPTLRDRLVVHMQDPTCAGCHEKVDPIGFGLENFDGVGRFRVEENGAVIDASGELGGAPFDGPRDLGWVLAHHPDLVPCFVERLYAYANGHEAEAGEAGQIDALVEVFQAGERRILPLLGAIATSEGFRRVGEVSP